MTQITDHILQALAAEVNAAIEHCPPNTAKLLASSIQARIEHIQTRFNAIPATPAAPDQQGPG